MTQIHETPSKTHQEAHGARYAITSLPNILRDIEVLGSKVTKHIPPNTLESTEVLSLKAKNSRYT